jgi:hypothetical protein
MPAGRPRKTSKTNLTPAYHRALRRLFAAESGLKQRGTYYLRPGDDVVTEWVPQHVARGLHRLGFATFEVLDDGVRLLITSRGCMAAVGLAA